MISSSILWSGDLERVSTSACSTVISKVRTHRHKKPQTRLPHPYIARGSATKSIRIHAPAVTHNLYFTTITILHSVPSISVKALVSRGLIAWNFQRCTYNSYSTMAICKPGRLFYWISDGHWSIAVTIAYSRVPTRLNDRRGTNVFSTLSACPVDDVPGAHRGDCFLLWIRIANGALERESRC